MPIPGATNVTDIISNPSGHARLNRSSAILFVCSGPDKGLSIPIGTQPLVVGTDSTCDVVLAERSVSRRHAQLYRSGEHVVVEDLGSTNGTFLYGARVREVFVPLGQSIAFGKVQIKFVPEELSLEAKPISGGRLGALVGQDTAMRTIFSLIDDVAASDVTVVIEGETGTGKELVAKAVHERSARSDGPLVVFDCSSQPKDLIESALFGHVKGAFTGATSARAGAFERANGGTIFLDELGEFGRDLQPKLLRVLESREVQRVGGDDYRPVDVRVIAATNRNLKSEVQLGNFREDLYYRLAVVKIVLPPLRERTQDIAVLAEHFFADLGRAGALDPACVPQLASHSWPGNVRELKNAVARAAALSRNSDCIDLASHLVDLDRASGSAADDYSLPFKEAKAEVVSRFEERYLAELLERHGNNISVAAREAGIDRKHFKDLMRKHGITAERGPGAAAESSS